MLENSDGVTGKKNKKERHIYMGWWEMGEYMRGYAGIYMGVCMVCWCMLVSVWNIGVQGMIGNQTNTHTYPPDPKKKRKKRKKKKRESRDTDR